MQSYTDIRNRRNLPIEVIRKTNWSDKGPTKFQIRNTLNSIRHNMKILLPFLKRQCCCFQLGIKHSMRSLVYHLALLCLLLILDSVNCLSFIWMEKQSNVFYRTSVLITMRSLLVKQKAEECLFGVISFGNKAYKVCVSVLSKFSHMWSRG